MTGVRLAFKKAAALSIAAWLMLSSLFISLYPAHAGEENEVKTVRAASVDSDLFLTLDQEGKPVSGYAYEYIETVAAYAGWKVEYVPCEGFAGCMEALLSGETDIFFDVSYSPERAEQLLFPNTLMGTEEYYLYCLSGNTDIHAMEYATYDGKRVGVTAGTSQVAALQDWCADKGISLAFSEFETIPEKEAALLAGEIDLDLELSLMARDDLSALDKIASDGYYLAVNRNRPDLLADINSACAKIISIDRLFFENLEEKYFARKLVSKTMTADEVLWVGTHDTLRIGYMNNYMPFSDTGATGEPTGIVTDLAPLMLDNIGLGDAFRIVYTGYDDNEEMYAALKAGREDCIFPVFGHLNYAIGKDALFSSSVIGITADLAYIGAYSEQTTHTIAVNGKNQLQAYYTGYFFPEAKILYCDTIEACLDAVVSGKAGSTILNGMRTTELLQNVKYSEINTITLPENAEFSFAVKEGNPALLSILNRAIASTDSFAATTLSYKYFTGRGPVSSVEFFREHPQYPYGAAAVLLAIVLTLVARNKRLAARRAEETRSEQIAKMAGGVSAYVVDPRTERFRILSQNEHLAGNYPEEEDFNTSITRYIQNDVFAPDREAATASINVPSIVAYLQEHDEYTFRFRDVSSGTPHWYEMRAIRLSEHEILYGFTDKTEEIVSELVLKNLSGQYTALYYVDLETDDYIPYHLVRETEDIRPFFERSRKFTDLARGFAESDLVHPEDKESLHALYPSPAAVKQALRDKKSMTVLFRRNYGGTYLWTEAAVVKCEKESDAAQTVIVCFMEKDKEVREKTAQITASEEANRLMENLVSHYNAAFTVNMADDSFICLKFDDSMIGKDEHFGNFTEVRDFFFRLLPATDKERMMHELDYATIRGKLSAVQSYDTVYRRSGNGTTVWQIMNVTAIDDDHIAVGFANRDMDIIRERVEEKRYEEYFALFEVDLDTGMLKIVKNLEHYQVVPVGDTVPYTPFIRNLGQKLNEEPRAFYMRISDLSYLQKVFAKEDKRTYSYKSSMIADGSKWIDVTAYVILRHEDGTPGVITIGFSIADELASSRQEIQAQLREAYREVEEARYSAEQANRSKTSFLFNMSHDIRTPMNAIKGFTGMAKKYMEDKEKVRDYLDKIDVSGQQLLTLVNQVLEMARIESGKIELEERPVSIRTEYDAAITVAGEQAKVNELEFHHSLTDITHDRVFADPARMNSITLNIVGNAMKYTPRGGRIDVILKEIPARKEGFASFVFTVADTGIGMSEEYQKVLFEPFTRERSSTVSKIQGTGLGMSIVKQLVDLMGGTIEVNSELNKGTRFDITIDFRIDEQDKERKESEQAKNTVLLAGRRVLLVEDNEMNREIAMDILEEEKLIVETAEDGTVAVELLREKGPAYYDFILMDIQMPFMDGYTATRQIRAMYPEAKLPIIALSANAFAEDKTASLAAGMDDHVAKPINMKELFASLEKFL